MSGSSNVAVSRMPSWGCTVDSVTVPGSSKFCMLTVTFFVYRVRAGNGPHRGAVGTVAPRSPAMLLKREVSVAGKGEDPFPPDDRLSVTVAPSGSLAV